MDGVDYYLVSKAEALAGRDIHRVANLVTIYLGWSHEHHEGNHRAFRLAIDAERKLRAFVCMKELALAHSQPARA